MTKLKSVLLVTTGIVIGASTISVLNAQGNAPYFEVAAINVTDQAGYEASGIDKVRDAIKAGGGKLIAGGYNKATTLEGDVAAANRFLFFQYPSKEAHEKVWTNDVKPWIEKVKGKYTDRFRVFGVEAAK